MTDTIPAIRKTFSVPLPPEAAFDRFTAGIGGWWPLGTHSLSASEGKVAQEVRVEPHVGGRVVETRHDGDHADWATITHWEPGRRLGHDWHVGRDRSQATHVALRFTGKAAATEVELVHDRFERLGAAGEAAAASYDEGWDLVLGERFRQACEE